MLSQERGLHVPVDLIRTVAIIGVILLHAANDLTSQVQMNTLEVLRWSTVDIYQSLGRVGVPLFVMLTGALLLQPSKLNEPIGVFFKKRVARIALPFVFWAVVFFAWDFLVEGQAVTSNFIIQGILTGPYYHFWYLYMLVGLYLFTPILRIIVAHAQRSLLKYFIVLWFLGAAIVPFLGLVSNYTLNVNLLLISGYIGYFLLGAYLLAVKVRRRTLVALMALGVTLTAVGTVIVAFNIGGGTSWFFQEYLSPTMILTSAAAFLLLNTVKMPSSLGTANTVAKDESGATQSETSHPSIGKRILHVISENTLPIFLFHVMILDCLQRGYFGFTLNGDTVNSIVGVPLATVLTFFISLAIIVPLKWVPGLRKLLG